ncbi:hypothetical protein BDN67DRAFT_415142 [Paxillus ammoniavirescens]|nr:hypothetical protein BDN67DRAFT_415142 [Paxillus ammoniavirescens]
MLPVSSDPSVERSDKAAMGDHIKHLPTQSKSNAPMSFTWGWRFRGWQHRYSPSCSHLHGRDGWLNFQRALEFGSAVGFAAVGSIETSVEATHGGPEEYHGRVAAFLFLLGVVSLEIISVSCLYQRKTDYLLPPELTDDLCDNIAA